MEVSALKHPAGVGRYGRSPLLRIQSDEHLIKLIRAGHDGAFEAIVGRYNTRLLSFCRHLLGSREDAEDVLQEAFSAAYHAILADDRPIHVRPWLYRIARNRCLNHLRRVPAMPTDAMDVLYAENGETTADKVHRREEFRLLVGDIHELAETQRTALLLREMEALSYEQIAEAMETTVSSVKSLLVRARVSLAEASEARLLSCEDIRSELAEVSEGLTKRPSTLVRRHLKHCERCVGFNQQLKRTNRALGALLPVGPLALLKGGVFHLAGHAGHGAATVTGSSATAGAGSSVAGSSVAGSGAAAGVAGAGASSGVVGAAAGSSSGLVSAGIGALATKTAAGLAVAAVFTAGVAVSHRPSPAAHKVQVNATQTHTGHTRAVALASRASAAKVSSRENRLSASPVVPAGTTHAGSASVPTTAPAPASSSASASHRTGTGIPPAITHPASSTPVGAVTSAGAATTAPSISATAGNSAGAAGASSSGPSKRHGTTISSPSNPSSASSGNILPLGGLTTPSPSPSPSPTLPGTGASSSTPPSPIPPAGSADSGDSGPVASGVTQIISSVTGGSSSSPGS